MSQGDFPPLGSTGIQFSLSPIRPLRAERPSSRPDGGSLYDFPSVLTLAAPTSGQGFFPCYAELLNVLGDGNCAFRVMALSTWRNECLFKDIKKYLCDYIEAHFDKYQISLSVAHKRIFMTFPSYKNYISRNGEWGSFVEFMVFAKCFNVGVLLWSNDDFYNHTFNVTKHSRNIHVKFNNNHFQLLKVMKEEPRQETPFFVLGSQVAYKDDIVELKELPYYPVSAILQLQRNNLLKSSLRDFKEVEALVSECGVDPKEVFILDTMRRKKIKVDNSLLLNATFKGSTHNSAVLTGTSTREKTEKSEPNVRDSPRVCESLKGSSSSTDYRHRQNNSENFLQKSRTTLLSQFVSESKGKKTLHSCYEMITSQGSSCRISIVFEKLLLEYCGLFPPILAYLEVLKKKYDMKSANISGIVLRDGSFHFRLWKVKFEGFCEFIPVVFFRDFLLRKFSLPPVNYKYNVPLDAFPKDTVDDIHLGRFANWGKIFYDHFSQLYEHEITEGPCKICDSCDLLFFPKNVLTISNKVVCLSCQTKLKKADDSVSKVDMKALPIDITSLNSIEERVMSPLIPFMSIHRFNRVKQAKLIGQVVLVPINNVRLIHSVPQSLSSVSTIIIALKKRLDYKSTYIDGWVRLDVIKRVLLKLTQESPLFQSLKVFFLGDKLEALEKEMGEIKLMLQDIKDGLQQEGDVDNEDEALGNENSTKETFVYDLPSVVPLLSQTLVVAPGEDKTPIPIWQHDFLEELAFLTLYGGFARKLHQAPKGKKVTYGDIVRMELLNKDRRFAFHLENIFFKFHLFQIKRLHSIINTRGRLAKVSDLRARDLLNTKSLDILFSDMSIYNEFRLLRGTPHYWDDVRKDLFAFLRQNKSPPTFFVSLSMADTRWEELVDILKDPILRKNSKFENKLAKDLSSSDRFEMINDDPVTCARYFCARRRSFFNNFLRNAAGIIGEVEDFFGVIEFQHRGSPHCHFLVWSKYPPDLTKMIDVVGFINQHVSTNVDLLPEDLRVLQTHKHTQRCQKRDKNGKSTCSFGFPRPPMLETCVLAPLSKETTKKDRYFWQNRFAKVVEYLDDLPPDANISFKQFLRDLEFLSLEEYIMTLRSSLSKETIFYERDVAHKDVNTFNILMLKRWRANMDIQFCLNPYAVGNYIAGYMCKGNKVMSSLFNRVKEDLMKHEELSFGCGLRTLGNIFFKYREVSVQEALFLLLGLPLRFASRAVEFINTSFPHNRIVTLKGQKEIENLPKDSSQVYHPYALVSYYVARPKALEDICLADFASMYNYRVSKEEDEFIDNDNPDEELLPHGSRIAPKKRSIPKVIRFVNSKCFDGNLTDTYIWEKVLLFIPFRDEKTLWESNYRALYMQQEGYIIEKIEEYSPSHEDWAAVIEAACKIDCDVQDIEVNDLDQGKDNDLNESFVDIPSIFDIFENEEPPKGTLKVSIVEPTSVLEAVRRLNAQQRAIVDHISFHLRTNSDTPLQIFITGGAGVGKSVTLSAITSLATLQYERQFPSQKGDLFILKLAPTGIAAFNIDGNTIHSALGFKVKSETQYPPLSGDALIQLGAKLRSVRIVIIDEISMVSVRIFSWIDERLKQIFSSATDPKPFGGRHVIICGDLFQLPPITGTWCFKSSKLYENLFWKGIQFFELTKIMRQKEDLAFAELLNRLREGDQTDDDVNLLASLQTTEFSEEEEDTTMHLFTTNEKVDAYNKELFKKQPVATRFAVEARDVDATTNRIIAINKNDTGRFSSGLSSCLELFQGCIVQIMMNLDTSDGLVNGATGIVYQWSKGIEENLNQSYVGTNDLYDDDLRNVPLKQPRVEVVVIWIKFYSESVGAQRRQRLSFLRSRFDVQDSTLVPITRIKKHFLAQNQGREVIRCQFPLYHRNATTVHKTQSLTLEKGVVDTSGFKKPGLVYVALSRFSSTKKLRLLNFDKSQIEQNREVVNKMRQLRSQEMQLHPIPLYEMIKRNSQMFFYQNVQSLSAHHQDISCIPSVSNVNLVAFVESRLTSPCSNYAALSSFADKMPCNRLEVPHSHGGLICFSDVLLKSCHIHSEPNLEILAFYYWTVKIILLHRHPKCPLPYFFEKLLKLLDSKERTIIIGDFNIDHSTHKNSSTFYALEKRGFQQIIDFPTTTNLTQIDHVWINDPSLVTKTSHVETYHSYHYPLIVQFLV